MKQTIIVLINILLAVSSLYSQDHIIDEIIVKTSYNDGDVMIRWLPKDYNLWQEGIQNGYLISRTTVNNAGNVRIDTLVSALKPLPRAQWSTTFVDNDFAKSAEMMLYDDSLGDTPDTINTLAGALQLREEREGRYFFAMTSAENDYEVAKAMGVAYTDYGMNDQKAVYTVTITSNGKTISGVGEIDTTTTLYQLSDLKALPTEGGVSLKWDFKEAGDTYGAWNIERSIDSITFEKINDLPYQHAYTKDEYEYRATYADQLSDCNAKYYYRIQGITSFGTVGPYSNIVSASCDDKIAIPMRLNGVKDMSSYTQVKWDNFDDMYEDSLQGFNIYRTEVLSEPPVRLNASMISKSTRHYDDMGNPNYAYYFLEAIDIHDKIHRSPEYFFQRYDTIPPAAPAGVEGEFVDAQRVRLLWTKNEEEDIKGYDVFIANQRNGSYIKANKNLLKEARFETEFSKSIETDSIFVKILAEDIFLNRSSYSDVIALARPDIWGPVAPILKFAYPENKGVALAWLYSPSDDVTVHKVQRRPSTSYTWTDLLIITNELRDSFPASLAVEGNSENANHLDNHDLKAQDYFYRIIALDEGKNEAASDRIRVKPFPTKELNVIKDLSIEVVQSTTPPSQETMDALNDMNSTMMEEQIKAMTVTDYKTKLQWKADIDPTMQSILIYRASSGDNFNVVKELSIAEALGDPDMDTSGLQGLQDMKYEDSTVKKNKTYVYYIVGKYMNGAESEQSQLVSIKIQ